MTPPVYQNTILSISRKAHTQIHHHCSQRNIYIAKDPRAGQWWRRSSPSIYLRTVAQTFLWSKHSPGEIWGTTCSARDRTQVSCTQGKPFTYCTPSTLSNWLEFGKRLWLGTVVQIRVEYSSFSKSKLPPHYQAITPSPLFQWALPQAFQTTCYKMGIAWAPDFTLEAHPGNTTLKA